MDIAEIQKTTTPQRFTDQWLQSKPKFRIHQRVITVSGVVGRISGIQQVPIDRSTDWRYQISVAEQYGETISWWEENQINFIKDCYLVKLLEADEEVDGCYAGTLDEALEDVRFYAQEASRQYQEFGRNMTIQFSCSNATQESPIESFEAFLH